jgi:hypothetical protein
LLLPNFVRVSQAKTLLNERWTQIKISFANLKSEKIRHTIIQTDAEIKNCAMVAEG